MKIHWDALTPQTQERYRLIAELPFISEFYLGGRTGLALQIGHRLSVDLDFFSDSPQSVDASQRKAIINTLKKEPSFKITWDKDDTLVANWKNVGLSFFRLDLHPLVMNPATINNIRVAVIEEIGAMKLAAILSRGTRKDYIDLYFILQQKNILQLFEIAAQKYPYNAAFPVFAVRALSFFDDAEAEPTPRMIENVNWENVKTFLEKQAMDVGRKRLALDKLWQRN